MIAHRGRRRNKQERAHGLDPTTFPALRLLGERLCIHFANTIESRASDHPEDYLRSYPDLVRWARHVGLITDTELHHMLTEAERRPAEAAAVLGRALELRDAIYQVFRATARGEPARQDDLDRLRHEYLAALGRARLTLTEGGYGWVWDGDGGALEGPLWPVARSAVAVLAEEDLGRIRECPGAGDCGWLFYDTSKNGTRRWCSMEGCGSRAKMRRQYARQRGVKTGAVPQLQA